MHANHMPSHLWSPREGADPDADEEVTGYSREGYYFWDETEAHVVGPFPSYDEAESARRSYRP